MTSLASTRRRTLVVAVALLAVSCGSGTASEPPGSLAASTTAEIDPTESSASEPPASTLTAATTATDTIDADSAATNDTVAAEPGAQRLSSLLSSERVGLGWDVPAGRWSTDAFQPAIEFDTSAPLTLIGEYADVVVFANPARPDSRNFLFIAKSSFIHDGTSRAPTPMTSDDITLVIERLEHVNLLANSTRDVDPPWWELSVENFSNGAPYGCELGDRCGPISFTRGNVGIDTLEGERSRFYRALVGDDQISVHATGEAAGIDDMIAIAHEIAPTVRLAEGERPDTEHRFFGTARTNGATIEPGSYIARYPDATLHFNLGELPAGMKLTLSKMNTIWIASSRVGIGFVPTNRFIDPTADQAMMEIAETVFEYAPPIRSNEAYLDWETAMHGTPAEVNTAVIAGLDAIWLASHADDATVITRPCNADDASDAEGECLTIWTTDNQAWWAPVTNDDEGAAETGRAFFLADAGLLVTVSTLDDSDVEDALEAVQPLLDSLTITPVNPSSAGN